MSLSYQSFTFFIKILPFSLTNHLKYSTPHPSVLCRIIALCFSKKSCGGVKKWEKSRPQTANFYITLYLVFLLTHPTFPYRSSSQDSGTSSSSSDAPSSSGIHPPMCAIWLACPVAQPGHSVTNSAGEESSSSYNSHAERWMNSGGETGGEPSSASHTGFF